MSSSSWEFAEGDAISTRLTAVSLLGGGAAYEAYLAFDQHLFAPVVVKVVRPDQTADASTLSGLERETDMVGALAHPAIVRGFHAVLGGERPHLVLENLDGPRLSSLVRRHGPMPMQQLLPLGLELASALHYLRERDVVHLDIKPSNIIMGAPPRLIDLSVARSSAEAARLTSPIGTDAWMAPEQCLPGAGGVPGFASDVWGLGTSLFYAAAGLPSVPARGRRERRGRLRRPLAAAVAAARSTAGPGRSRAAQGDRGVPHRRPSGPPDAGGRRGDARADAVGAAAAAAGGLQGVDALSR